MTSTFRKRQVLRMCTQKGLGSLNLEMVYWGVQRIHFLLPTDQNIANRFFVLFYSVSCLEPQEPVAFLAFSRTHFTKVLANLV